VGTTGALLDQQRRAGNETMLDNDDIGTVLTAFGEAWPATPSTHESRAD
jgi:hypothetical protein